MRYQPNSVERVRLDVAQQPFHGDEGNDGRNDGRQQDHAPVFLRRQRIGMVQGLENFPGRPPRASSGMPTRKENSVAAGRFRPSNSAQQNRRAGTGRAGKNRRDQLADGHGDDDGPGDFVAQFFPAQPPFDGEKGDAADEQGPGDGRRIFRQFETLFVEDEAHGAGDDEGDEDFQQVILRFLLAPFKDEFVKALRETAAARR